MMIFISCITYYLFSGTSQSLASFSSSLHEFEQETWSQSQSWISSKNGQNFHFKARFFFFLYLFLKVYKAEKILKGSLNSIPSPSPSLNSNYGWESLLEVYILAKHCWVLSTNFLFSKVCWQCLAMFCLYSSN